MARQYYGTSQEIYQLFISHPVMSSLLDEFNIDEDYDPNDPTSPIRLRDVCDYLVAHEEELKNELNGFYNDSELIQELAELYGFDSINYPPPYTQYQSDRGTTLEEFLNLTLYYYKFATIDNFYEKNFLNFIPEYDREAITANPKLQLTFESIGRELDNLEDKIIRLGNVYDADEVPEELLDYLGQNIGYEKEDYTLNGLSFRELLKNIIEIYKIKGTNHSFSFFFKFLGFEVNLKEFYFNRDAKNAEKFPGVEESNVEFYLTTKNPIFDTTYRKPAPFLYETRNLSDWDIEWESLSTSGCVNPEKYMLGEESYNYDLVTWHKNPWTYFKTNLIEYELNPFLTKLNLTASDNETIRKYVKFLSPTYLFTWININLAPWIEDVNIIKDLESDWRIYINQMLGDPRPTPNNWPAHQQGSMGVPENTTGVYNKKTAADPGFNGLYNDGNYLNYEPMGDYIALYDPEGDKLVFNLVNNMNLNGDDVLGALLRRDGTHIRQEGHPSHFADAKHRGDKRLSFDNLALQLKDYLEPDSEYEDYSFKSYPPVPDTYYPREGRTVKTSNIVDLSWNNSPASVGYRVQLSTQQRLLNTIIDEDTLISPEYTTQILPNNKYYWRVKVKNNATNYPEDDPSRWTSWSPIWSFTLKTLPFPFAGEEIKEETYYVNPNYGWNTDYTGQTFLNAELNLEWDRATNVSVYHCQLSSVLPVDNVFLVEQESEELITPEFNVSLGNNTYYWRHRYKDRLTKQWSNWSQIYNFKINFPMNI